MRRSLLALLGATAAVLILAWWLRGRSDPQNTAPKTGSSAIESDPRAAPPVGEEAARLSSQASVSNLTTTNETPAELTGDALTQKIEQVEALAENNDAASLAALLVELRHPMREVRAAAIRAAVQMGEGQAAPALRALATNSTDAVEKVKATEAAEFLELPKFEEFRENRRKEAAAASNTVAKPRK